jgi:hypothetical protein
MRKLRWLYIAEGVLMLLWDLEEALLQIWSVAQG